MKSVGSVLLGVMIAVISLLAYYNYKQQQTINILNKEVLEQARLRHILILEKYALQQRIENEMLADTIP